MPNQSFDAVAGKVERAKFHIKELAGQLNDPANLNRYGVGWRIDYERREAVIFGSTPQELYNSFGIIIGEVIHQLRSALEHTVWQLVILNGKSPDKRTGFPIFWNAASDKTKYLAESPSMLSGVNTKAVAIIDGLQPMGPDYATHPLYVLNEMWNWDKHRLLNLVSVAPIAFQVSFIYPGGRVEQKIVDVPPGVQIIDGTEIKRISFPDDYTPEVKVVGVMAGIYKFDVGPAAGQSFTELLNKLVEFAESLINKLIATI